MSTKVCTSCGLEKPVEEFSWKTIIRRKRHARCKTCTAKDSGKWYEDNKHHHKENVRVNRHKSKEREGTGVRVSVSPNASLFKLR